MGHRNHGRVRSRVFPAKGNLLSRTVLAVTVVVVLLSIGAWVIEDADCPAGCQEGPVVKATATATTPILILATPPATESPPAYPYPGPAPTSQPADPLPEPPPPSMQDKSVPSPIGLYDTPVPPASDEDPFAETEGLR